MSEKENIGMARSALAGTGQRLLISRVAIKCLFVHR